MNCICGKPISEHGEGKETDECVTRAITENWDGEIRAIIGTPMTGQSISFVWMDVLLDHLTADDNPVEHVTIGWDRSDGEWYVGMEGWYPPESDKPSGYYSVTADTLPLALCRAVLTLYAVEAGDE